MTKESLVEAFGIPAHNKLVKFKIDTVKNFYIDNLEKALEMINVSWIDKPRSHYSKFPKLLYKSDFKVEYNGMIALLSRVMGLEKASIFEDWMFYVITQIEKSTNYLWVGLINDNLDRKLRED